MSHMGDDSIAVIAPKRGLSVGEIHSDFKTKPYVNSYRCFPFHHRLPRYGLNFLQAQSLIMNHGFLSDAITRCKRFSSVHSQISLP